MPKNKPIYVCTDCGYESAKWMGRCPSCGAWNKMEEQAPAAPAPAAGPARKSTVLAPAAPAKTLLEIEESEQERVHSGIGEFDRVLGGGIVPGSLVLIGGDPGIGKSTLLLQVSALLAEAGARVLYASGEESTRQIKMRAKRLGLAGKNLYVMSETNMDEIEAQREALSPDFLIVDSIQTVYVPHPHARGQAGGHDRLPRRARNQGGGAGRPARAGAHGGRGALLRGRPPPGLPHPARGQEPLRLRQRDRRLPHGADGHGAGGEPLGVPALRPHPRRGGVGGGGLDGGHAAGAGGPAGAHRAHGLWHAAPPGAGL